MALTATIYQFTIELADVDRSVYEILELRVARQPSESAEYLFMRLLAYCLEYCEGIELTQGVAAGDEPAVLVRDLTGQVTHWVEIGLPAAERLHRGARLAGRAAVYTHRDVTQLLNQLAGKKIYRAAEIPIYAIERRFVDEAAALLERRMAFALSVTEREIYLSVGDRTLTTTIVEHRIDS